MEENLKLLFDGTRVTFADNRRGRLFKNQEKLPKLFKTVIVVNRYKNEILAGYKKAAIKM